MTKRVTLSLLLLAGALLACSDSGHLLAPTSDSPNTQFAAVQVSPVSLELSTLAPWNTAVVTAKAVTRAGGTVPNSGLVVAYSSSAPATATVSDSGLITGLTPGDAVITVAMTLEDVTHTADVTVAVHEPGSWPAVGGVYDLTATITHSDRSSRSLGILSGMPRISFITVALF